MGRLSARLASSPVDRDVLKNLAESERYLLRVMEVLRSNRKNPNVRLARVSELELKIQKALKAIQDPPALVSKIDQNDPDFMTPKQRRDLKRKQKKNRGTR